MVVVCGVVVVLVVVVVVFRVCVWLLFVFRLGLLFCNISIGSRG